MITACHAPIASLLPIRIAGTPSWATHLKLPFRNQLISLALTDVVRLEGAGNYTYIHTVDNRRYLLAKTLKSLEPTLNDAAFCRVHKSTIINLDYLTGINFGERPHLFLKSSQPVAISRRRLPATRLKVKQYRQRAAGRKSSN